MNNPEAIAFIQSGVPSQKSLWADIGAGTGVFTLALRSLLPEKSKIYALDKSPHALWSLTQEPSVEIIIEDADFNRPLNLPLMDGMIMANALHYSPNQAATLENILKHLKVQGHFILIEYEIDCPQPPWIPHPVPFQAFQRLAQSLGLSEPKELHRQASHYGAQYIYSALSQKLGESA